MKPRLHHAVAAFFLIGMIAASSLLFADTVTSSDRYFPDSGYQYDADMRAAELPRSFSGRGVQYGGWITPVFMDQRDGDNSLTTAMISARLWLKAYLWDHSYVYIRVKNVFLGVLYQDGFNLDRADNVVDLDVGFIEISNSRHSMTLTLGRKFFLLGTGLVLDGRGDGLQFDFRTSYISGTFFGMYTGLILKDDNPYGMSDKDISTGARRVFVGGSLSTDFYNQTLYVLGLVQLDFGAEHMGIQSRYNSLYYGIGINGVLFTGLYYYAEFVYELGKDVLSGTTRLKNIMACAGTFSLYYYFNTMLNPVIIAQYGFGSGDPSRNNYRNPTGNSEGNDWGFIYFGTYSGGYGLRPLLANVHVLRGGFALTPFDWTQAALLKQMNIVVKYSYYLKHRAQAGINYGADALKNSRDIGHGLDLSLRWKMFHDLSFFVNYGLFAPGAAYDSSEDIRHFTMVGFNFIF
ncbi:MAG: alginate export family protein [Spirochaetes bacterium]|nr:alginate export family protein [Spirochaetota bacterium]